MRLIDVYYKLPISLQNLVCSFRGLIISLTRYNTRFKQELVNYENGVYDPLKSLREFLLIAKKSPFYSVYFDSNAIDIKAENLYDEIKKLPIINKDIIKKNLNEIRNPKYNGKTFLARTSGTTGGALIFPCSREMENKQWAVWWRYRKRLGISFNTWCGWFGGKIVVDPSQNKPPFWRINYPGRQIMFSSVHLGKGTVQFFYNKIQKESITWLHGYPSYLSLLAGLIVSEKLQPLSCVKFITTGAENLYDQQIEQIQRAFPKALIRQHYGLSEGVANFSQSVKGKWTIDNDFAYVEFIPCSKSNPNICRIIGTGFSNYAFPLVRYDTGDIAVLGEDSSIEKIIGRNNSVIVFSNGQNISEAALSILLHDYINIIEAQFHQKSADVIDLWIVKAMNYSQIDELSLYNSLIKIFPPNVTLSIKYVEKVQRTSTGKLRLIIKEF